jgi:hypothetical protein
MTITRGPQVRPTKTEIREAWRNIRAAAAGGDVQACGLLIQLADHHHCEDGPRSDVQRLGIEDNENGDKAQVLAAFIEAAPVLRELLDAK